MDAPFFARQAPVCYFDAAFRVTFEIAADGEVLAKGPNIVQGYFSTWR